jgi:hypothetical protein
MTLELDTKISNFAPVAVRYLILVFIQVSPMHRPAKLFLSLRALGAPANVIMLAVQGIFRGFKDTKTPVFYIGNYQEILYKYILQLHHLSPVFYGKIGKATSYVTDFEISPKGGVAKAHPCTWPHCRKHPTVPMLGRFNSWG